MGAQSRAGLSDGARLLGFSFWGLELTSGMEPLFSLAIPEVLLSARQVDSAWRLREGAQRDVCLSVLMEMLPSTARWRGDNSANRF